MKNNKKITFMNTTFFIYHSLFQKGEEFLTISSTSWENLMSRVLLLETKLELSNPQVGQVQ